MADTRWFADIRWKVVNEFTKFSNPRLDHAASSIFTGIILAGRSFNG